MMIPRFKEGLGRNGGTSVLFKPSINFSFYAFLLPNWQIGFDIGTFHASLSLELLYCLSCSVCLFHLHNQESFRGNEVGFTK